MSLGIPPNPPFVLKFPIIVLFYLALYTSFQILIEMKVVLEYFCCESWLKIFAAASAKLVRYLSVGMQSLSLSSSQAGRKQNQPTNHSHFIHIMSPSIFNIYYYYYYLSLGSVSMLRKRTIIYFSQKNEFHFQIWKLYPIFHHLL
jgi:hypothetical protein